MKNSINAILLVILLTGTMFLSTNSFVDGETISKHYIFLLITILLGGISFAAYKGNVKVDLLSAVFILFITYLVVVIFYSNVNIQVIYYIGGFILYVVFKTLLDNKTITFCNNIIVTACVSQAIYGILQYTGVIKISSSFPITGSFDNPAGFAACTVLGIPFALFSAKTKSKTKYLYFISVAVICIALIFSQSRAGILSAFTMFVVYLYCRFIHSLPLKKKSLILSLITALSVSIFLFLFFFKQDSATGRYLIWQSALSVISENPIKGYGNGGFNAHYMSYQANYFQHNPNSDLAVLADNVVHPFNEYFFLAIEYGIIGLLLFLALISISLFYNKRKLSPYILAFISILVFASFSYPFRYSFVWMIFVYSLARLSINTPIIYSIKTKFQLLISVVLIAGLVFIGYWLYRDIQFEYKWNKVAKSSLMGKTKIVLPEYERLYTMWNGNPMFLYNYGAELNHIQKYEESIRILNECRKYLNDYDVTMLQADNYFKLKQWGEAEIYYKKASQMCPVRFVPLYYLYQVYDSAGLDLQAKDVAMDIINKPVKILSNDVVLIKSKMNSYLKEKLH